MLEARINTLSEETDKRQEEIKQINDELVKKLTKLHKISAQSGNTADVIYKFDKIFELLKQTKSIEQKTSTSVEGKIIPKSQGGDGSNINQQISPNAETPSMSRDRHDGQLDSGNQSTHPDPNTHTPSMNKDQGAGLSTVLDDIPPELAGKAAEELGKGLTNLAGKAKDFFSKDNLNVTNQGYTYKDGVISTGLTATDSSALQGSISQTDLYDPVTEMVNPDPTQRIEMKNGIIDNSPSNISAQPELSAASSQPHGREELYSSPNSKSIKETLYSSVKNTGANYLKGYLVGRSIDLMFGKKVSKKVSKYAGHYATANTVGNIVAPTAWNAAKAAIGGVVSNAWSSIATSAIGRAVDSAWGAVAKSAIGKTIGGAISSLAGSTLGTAIGPILPWVGVAMMVYSIFKMFF